MKVSKDLLDALDRTPAASSVRPLPTKSSAEALAPTSVVAAGEPTAQAPLVVVLKRAMPRLWHKVTLEKLTRREQRGRLCDLLQWLVTKEHASAAQRAPRHYEHAGRVVEGRVDLRIEQAGAAPMDVEICFDATEAAVRKLYAAKRAGHQCLMVCGFAGSVEEALRRLNKVVPMPSWNWLQLAFLAPA